MSDPLMNEFQTKRAASPADNAATGGVDILALAKRFAPEAVYLRLRELEEERAALLAQAEAGAEKEAELVKSLGKTVFTVIAEKADAEIKLGRAVAERDAAVRENATLRKNIKDEAVQTILAKEYGSAQFARAEAAERAAEHAQAALRRIEKFADEHMGCRADNEDIRDMARAALTGEGTESCPGWPNCRCRNNEWASEEDPHGAFGAPGMMGG